MGFGLWALSLVGVECLWGLQLCWGWIAFGLSAVWVLGAFGLWAVWVLGAFWAFSCVACVWRGLVCWVLGCRDGLHSPPDAIAPTGGYGGFDNIVLLPWIGQIMISGSVQPDFLKVGSFHSQTQFGRIYGFYFFWIDHLGDG